MSDNNMNEAMVNQVVRLAVQLERQKTAIVERYGPKEPNRG